MSAPALAAAVAFALSAAAAAATPGERLLAALWAGDRLELARAGRALGALTLADEIASSERARVLAAVAAAPHAENAWLLLGPLAALAEGPERRQAVAAARAAASIARALDTERALRLDVPSENLRESLGSWRELARDPGRWADVRVEALTAVRELGETLGEDALAFDAGAHARDAEPEVRRAALELLPQPLSPEHQKLAAQRAREDPDPDVAAVALQALCGGIAAGDDEGAILDVLGQEGLRRLHTLLREPPGTAPAAALMDAALCAYAAGDSESRRALSRFRGRLDSELRDVLRARREWLE